MTKFISTMLLFSSVQSFAGGIGSGGGGTVSQPATPNQVAEAVQKSAGALAQMWLQRKQVLNAENIDHGAYEPIKKIFASTTDIYTVLHQTRVELKMTAPCQDANGAPVDGSIYGSQPGAICISPFSMAPKLNQQNYVVETAALVLHEMSHLVGLNEDDATSLQTRAVQEFMEEDLAEVLQGLQDLGSNAKQGKFTKILKFFDKGINDPGFLTAQNTENYFKLWTEIHQGSAHGRFLFLSARNHNLSDPQYVNYGAIASFVCFNDSSVEKSKRKECQDEFNEGFGADTTVTARVFLSRIRNADPADYRSEYDLVIVDKPVTLNDLPAGLAKSRAFVAAAQAAAKELSEFQIATFAN